MVRGLFNWTFNDVVKFLKENNFTHVNNEGSHYYYLGHNGGNARLVQVPFHGSKALKPRTLKAIILQSGISKEKWLK